MTAAEPSVRVRTERRDGFWFATLKLSNGHAIVGMGSTETSAVRALQATVKTRIRDLKGESDGEND